MHSHRPRVFGWFVMALAASAGVAQTPPCRPCAGIIAPQPTTVLPELQAAPLLGEEDRLYFAWEESLSDAIVDIDLVALAATGAVPWIRMIFDTPAPLTENLDRLELELEAAATLAARVPARPHFQIIWRPSGSPDPAVQVADYSFLLKRASVAVTGAVPDARVISAPLPSDPVWLNGLYGEEVAAYLDGVALAPAESGALDLAIEALTGLDPGKPITLDALDFPAQPTAVLAAAARAAAAGFAVTLFRLPAGAPPTLTSLKILAREFQGDLSFDPYSTPRGDGVEAWTFVRGEDLGLRVIVDHGPVDDQVELTFSDRQLRGPQRIEPSNGEALTMYGGIKSADEYQLSWQAAVPVTVLRLERLSAEEIEGIAGLDERVTVISERQLPVEEILRRLQAFEDGQRRHADTYRAVNTTHLRFQFGTEGLEITFEGQIFFRQGEGYDWAWERFQINGLAWKGRNLPQIPLIEPKRAAQLPLEILFRPDYRYHLRGTAEVNGRDCWVVDFRPLAIESGESLFRGTVWIDREHFGRVRSRAVQLGLEGDVISNEETIHYTPVDHQGHTAEWSSENLWLPLRVVSQQIWSLFNTSTVVEKETLLSQVTINDPEFEAARVEMLDSDVTMVRDTAEGTRYLVVDKETGERVVQERFNPNRLFLVGGVFFDESFDFPIPLVGIDFFSLDFKETGSQLNVFFAGALLTADIADPDLFGSKFDGGADFFVFGIPATNSIFRNGIESLPEEVEQLNGNVEFTLGRRFGNFTKFNLAYRLAYTDFDRTDETAEGFVVPVNHFTNTVRLNGAFSRSGYRLRANASYSDRSKWEPWGFPAAGEFDPDQKSFQRWDASLSKTFHLKKFRKVGFELQYLDGNNLDRFSKYEFGFFSDVRVRGYQSEKVRAERAAAIHGSYGFELNELLRLQFVADTAWATDEASGFDQEFLAGVGIAGTVVGPWKTLVRLDLGAAVAGPDDGFALFLAFLKLFR